MAKADTYCQIFIFTEKVRGAEKTSRRRGKSVDGGAVAEGKGCRCRGE